MKMLRFNFVLALLLSGPLACAPDDEPEAAPPIPDMSDMNVPDTELDDGTPDLKHDPDQDDLGQDAEQPEDMSDMDPDLAANPCDGVECGAGTCVSIAGGLECACDVGFAGARCDSCDPAYEGADCDSCAEGFVVDPASGACVRDRCQSDPCNGNGACSVVTDATGAEVTECACNLGFAGDACDSCEVGYEGLDCDSCAAGFTMENGACVILACSPAPCDRGICVDADGDGEPECVCERGWTGRDCGTCAQGFVLNPANGECVLDVCTNVSCDNGTCVASGNVGTCLCDEGYTGTSCSSCAYGYSEFVVNGQTRCLNDLPIRDARITGWFDAAMPSTLDLVNGDGVKGWRNRVQPYSMREPGPAAHRPRYVLNPEPGVEFDGNDALWTSQSLVGITDAYSIFIVVTWGTQTTGDVIVDSFFQNSHYLPYRIMAWNDLVQFRHGVGAGIPDMVQHAGFPTSGPRLAVVQRQPFFNGQAMVVSNGVDQTVGASTKPNLTEETLAVLGAEHSNAVWGSRGLDGRIHEVIYVKGALTVSERDAISAYLKVKWGL